MFLLQPLALGPPGCFTFRRSPALPPWPQMNPETLHCFEFCDLLVSICVLVYVGNCAISSSVMHTAQRNWDRIAHTSVVEVIEDVYFYLERLETSRWKRFKHRFSSGWRDDADFKMMELLFKSKFHLPHNFDYVHYIKLVLEDVVVTTANISTWHWVILMGINAVWWLGMVHLLPLLNMDPTPESEKICMLDCPAEARRRLGGASAEPETCQATLFRDTCTMNTTELDLAWLDLRSNTSQYSYWNVCGECLESLENLKEKDITSAETLRWLVMFTVIGWLLALTQLMVTLNLHERMRRILKIHNVDEPENIPGLLKALHENVVEHAMRQKKLTSENKLDMTADDGENERVDHVAVEQLHHMHLIDLDEDDEDMDLESDHIMIFSKSGKTSNDIISIREYEMIMFLTQLVQLVIDFYFGFYFVHMNQRVPKAFGYKSISEGATMQQAIFHGLINGSVVCVFLLLMVTTKKISLLIGVLHLSDKSVTEVLAHMDLIKSLRNRIQRTLTQTELVRGEPRPEEAAALLDRAREGELALLAKVDPSQQQISRAQMEQLFAQFQAKMTVTKEQLDEFLDRETFQRLGLLPAAQQLVKFRTGTSAKTLVISEAGAGEDTVEVADFTRFIVQCVTDIRFQCMELSPSPEAMASFEAELLTLSVVDNTVVESASMVARAKVLFTMADTDGGGALEKDELYGMLRRFKVPITKQQFKPILRMIDPDQSGDLEMDEWLNFMMASDDDLEQVALDAAIVQQVTNAKKGTELSTVLGEGVGLFLGEFVH